MWKVFNHWDEARLPYRGDLCSKSLDYRCISENSFTARRVFDQETRCGPQPHRGLSPTIAATLQPAEAAEGDGTGPRILATPRQETPGRKIQFSQNPWHLLKLGIQRKSIQENSSWAWGELKLPHEKMLGFRLKS